MMATKSPPPMTNITSFLPIMRPLNPGHDISLNPDPPVLDLCVRKPSVSPDFPHDYKNSEHPPIYVDPPISSPRCQSRLSETSEVSSSEGRDINSNSPTHRIKPSRPFKAYPKVPLSLAFIGTTPDLSIMDSAEAYAEFRRKMLSQVQATHNGTNKNMRRTQSQNPQITDPAYWEKRKKNNEAAKRSRDARRAKEDEIAVRCSFLEQENMQLKIQVAALKESLRLKSMGWQS